MISKISHTGSTRDTITISLPGSTDLTIRHRTSLTSPIRPQHKPKRAGQPRSLQDRILHSPRSAQAGSSSKDLPSPAQLHTEIATEIGPACQPPDQKAVGTSERDCGGHGGGDHWGGQGVDGEGGACDWAEYDHAGLRVDQDWVAHQDFHQGLARA